MEHKTTQSKRTVPAHLPMRVRGKVTKWFSGDGYGFISALPTETVDIFVHNTVVSAAGRSSLLPGQAVDVTYRQIEGGKLRATKIEFPQ